jgi:hypothetical protein
MICNGACVTWAARSSLIALLAASLLLGASPGFADSVTGDYPTLDIDTHNQPLSQTGPVTVAGTTNLVTGTGMIILSTVSNDLQGVVNASGAGISLADLNGLNLGNIDAGVGTVILDVGGTISQSGSMTAGTLDVNAGGNVTLTNSGNSIAALGPIDAAGAFALTNSQALAVTSTIDATSVTFTVANGVTVNGGAVVTADQVVMNTGVLSVQGAIDGDLEIKSTATLAGTGTVGDTAIRSGGTLAAGNSIGSSPSMATCSWMPARALQSKSIRSAPKATSSTLPAT